MSDEFVLNLELRDAMAIEMCVAQMVSRELPEPDARHAAETARAGGWEWYLIEEHEAEQALRALHRLGYRVEKT